MKNKQSKLRHAQYIILSYLYDVKWTARNALLTKQWRQSIWNYKKTGLMITGYDDRGTYVYV